MCHSLPQYTSSQTLYSTGFNPSTKLYMSSGNGVSFVTNSTGTYVVSTDASKSSARVIRSDILLEGGGVLHVSTLAHALPAHKKNSS